jgi:hypothetical protein
MHNAQYNQKIYYYPYVEEKNIRNCDVRMVQHDDRCLVIIWVYKKNKVYEYYTINNTNLRQSVMLQTTTATF